MGESTLDREGGYLHRTWYRTDALPPGTPGEHPDGVLGMFSAQIPGSAFRGRTIIAVDWSTPGEVWVTFLLPGRSPVDWTAAQQVWTEHESRS